MSSAKALREEVIVSVKTFGDSIVSTISELITTQTSQFDSLGVQFGKLTEANENRLEAVRVTVDGKLKQIQEDNTRQLELMRTTVDEKLHSTLEKRLGESFKQVSDRLEQVHKGLGEMQTLATGVGDLKRVLTNVKTRGEWGEFQLGVLLEEMLSPDQFEKNVKTKEGSNEIVEFAIKLPGRGDDGGTVVWLPIDAKFPTEAYHRLLDAQEKADPEAIEEAAKTLTAGIRTCAKDIHDKHLNPPVTTDFGIMFLPSESLYAEVVRRPGLIESIQHEFRVNISGPSTFAALLNSLQMGFRTLAIQKRSSEVWQLLGAVKSEFTKFGDILDGVKKKLDQASTTMDLAARKSRTISRKLRDVQELPSAESDLMLVGAEEEAAVEEV
ncbi:MAG: DNA recombination protein RmuC [Acidobacteriia bacterium]|nr:DNA recombination protein RmuC [Terriglobia bacterium]